MARHGQVGLSRLEVFLLDEVSGAHLSLKGELASSQHRITLFVVGMNKKNAYKSMVALAFCGQALLAEFPRMGGWVRLSES